MKTKTDRLCILVTLLVLALPSVQVQAADVATDPVRTLGYGYLSEMAISSDDRWVVTAGPRGAHLWDLSLGQMVRTFSGHSGGVEHVRFSPDGTQLLTGGQDGITQLWDVATGSLVVTFPGSRPVISPDGKRVLTAGFRDIFRLWDVSSGDLLWTFPSPVYWRNWKHSFSADGSIVFMAGFDRLLVLDALTGSLIHDVADIRNPVPSPDGFLVWMEVWETGGQLMAVETGEVLQHEDLNSHESPIWSPDGTRLALVRAAGNIGLWDIQSRQFIREFGEEGQWLAPLTFSPSGQYLLGVQFDPGLLIVWDAGTGEILQQLVIRQSHRPTAVFLSDGTNLVILHDDLVIQVRDVTTGLTLSEIEGHTTSTDSIAVTPDGTRMASANSQRAILWNLHTGEIERSFVGHEAKINSVAISPDGTYLLAGSQDKSARLWNISTGAQILSYEGHEDRVVSVAFSPDGTRVLTGSEDRTSRIWNSQSGELLHVLECGTRISSAVFSPDGAQVVTGSEDAVLRFWNSMTGELLQVIENNSSFGAIAWLPDGFHVVVAGWDQDPVARLWDVRIQNPVRSFKLHTQWLSAVAVSPDGTLLLTGSGDHTACLWDVATGALLRVFLGTRWFVTSLAFSADGSQVIVAGGDGLIRLWDIRDVAARPRLIRGSEGLEIIWMQGRLQVADDLNGPWITLAEATSPFSLNAAASRRFYRTTFE
jgi:WD40 repeat protein